MKELHREKYLSRIRPFYDDTEIIKVITGVRRCGKSTVMKQIVQELLDSGVEQSNIAFLDLDSKRYRKVSTADELEAEIDALIPSEGPGRYIFVDEVQNVKDFESVVNAYRNDGASVFITGSNSYLLSGEMVTKLTGRYMEFDVFPFSLSEVRDYKLLNGIEFDPNREFQDYLVNGGFPRRFSYPDNDQQADYVRAVVREVVDKDIRKRKKVRNIQTFERILEYLLFTPSTTVSSTSIADYMRGEHVKILPSTVNRYLDMIFASRLISKCSRVDIVGKKALKTLYKSYVADPALHSYATGPRTGLRIGMMLENVVYNELVSRGYEVAVGKFGSKEVDFVVTKGLKKAFVQVTYVMESPETEDREEATLLAMRDASPKYIITMDPVTIGRNGIIRLNLVNDFLLGDGFRLG